LVGLFLFGGPGTVMLEEMKLMYDGG
jgi:hypothetical protein